MMFPSVFGENLFDDWMDDFGFRDNFFSGKNPLYGKHAKNIMKTDVRETDKGYELDVDLPGFKKDEVQVQLKDGYLTISAAKGLDKDEEDKKGHYIRQERYSGAMSRTFYVGEDVKQEDIKAKFENGILSLSVPKPVEQKKGKLAYIPDVEEMKAMTVDKLRALARKLEITNMTRKEIRFANKTELIAKICEFLEKENK